MEPLYFVCLLMLVTPCNCFLFSERKVDINPKDAFAFVGDKITYWFQLLDAASFPLSEVSMDVFPQDDRGEPFTRSLILVNQTHGYVEINITEGIGGRTNLNCNHFGSILCGATVIVEQPLENISAIQSVWHYHRIGPPLLEITWQLNQQYFRLENFDVSAVINPGQEPTDSSSACTLRGANSCEIETPNGGIHFFRVSLKLNSINKRKYDQSVAFNEVAKYAVFETSYTTMIIPKDQVKPVIHEPLTAENVTSNCVTIRGPVPYSIKDHKYTLKYETGLFNSETEEIIQEEENELSATFYENFGMSVTFCNLTAATKYNASFRVKVADSGYWSNISFIVFITREDRPAQAPPLLPTSFYTGPCYEGLRDVTFYWNKPLKSYTNGKVTKYGVSFHNTNATRPESANYASQRTPCDITYEIELYSFTKVGRSLKSSSLIIPNIDEDIELKDDLDFTVMIFPTNGAASLTIISSWKISHLEEAKGIDIVIYLCKASPLTLIQCEGDFITHTFPLTKLSVKISNLALNINKFGYALRKGSRLRGINWISCKYDPTIVPEKPTQVKTFKGDQPGSVEVTWVSSQCTGQDMTLILRNHLRFCPIGSKRSCTDAEVEGRFNTSYQAKSLDPSQSYYVTVRSESLAGLGPESDPVLAIPMEHPEDQTWLYSLISVPLVVIMIFLLAVFLRYRCVRRVKVSIFMTQVKMTLPVYHQDILKKKDSGESGISSDLSESTEASYQDSKTQEFMAAPQNGCVSQSILIVSSISLQEEKDKVESVSVSKTEPLTPPVISSSSPISPHAAVPEKCEDLPESNNPSRDSKQESDSQSATTSKVSENSCSPYMSINFKRPYAAVPEKFEDLPESNNPLRDSNQESDSQSATTSKVSENSCSPYMSINFKSKDGKNQGVFYMPHVLPADSKTCMKTPVPYNIKTGNTSAIGKVNNPENTVIVPGSLGNSIGWEEFSLGFDTHHKRDVEIPIPKQHQTDNCFPSGNLRINDTNASNKEDHIPINSNGVNDFNQDINVTEMTDFIENLNLGGIKKVPQMPPIENNNASPTIEPLSSSHNSSGRIERKISEDSGVTSPGAEILEENPFPSSVMKCISEVPWSLPGSSSIKGEAFDEPKNSGETKSFSNIVTCPEVPTQNQPYDWNNALQQSHSGTSSVPPGHSTHDVSHSPTSDSDYVLTVFDSVAKNTPYTSKC